MVVTVVELVVADDDADAAAAAAAAAAEPAECVGDEDESPLDFDG